MTHTLVVDAANVVGTRPDGWWKDRAGAAQRLHERLLVADLPHDRVVLVLEGAAKGGVRPGRDGHLQTSCTPRGAATTRSSPRPATAVERGDRVTVVTADRLLRARVEGLGAMTMSPAWLLDLLG